MRRILGEEGEGEGEGFWGWGYYISDIYYKGIGGWGMGGGEGRDFFGVGGFLFGGLNLGILEFFWLGCKSLFPRIEILNGISKDLKDVRKVLFSFEK